MNAEKLAEYPLELDDYDSFATISGTIVDIARDNEFKIEDDGGLVYPVLMHPDILKAYADQDYLLSSGDEIEVFGAFIPVRNKPTILALRCMLYDEGNPFKMSAFVNHVNNNSFIN